MDHEGRQRVLIEFRVPAGEGDAIAMATHLLPDGVTLDQNYAPVELRPSAAPDEGATPSPGSRTVVLRGTATPEALEALRADPNVSVWNDGPIAAFGNEPLT